MGIDIYYQAMPPDCRLLELARNEPEFGSGLDLLKLYASKSEAEISSHDQDGHYVDFIREVKRAVRDFPGLENRNLALGRRWDMIHYLLSEYRRGGDGNNESDWAKRAVQGGDYISENAKSGIGVSLLYLQPEEVSAISKQLNRITSDVFGEHMDGYAMWEAGVYKAHMSDGAPELGLIEEDFERMRDFFRLVAAHNEGILTFWQ